MPRAAATTSSACSSTPTCSPSTASPSGPSRASPRGARTTTTGARRPSATSPAPSSATTPPEVRESDAEGGAAALAALLFADPAADDVEQLRGDRGHRDLEHPVEVVAGQREQLELAGRGHGRHPLAAVEQGH